MLGRRHARPIAPRQPATRSRGDDDGLHPRLTHLLGLQRTVGNRAVGTLLRRPLAVQRGVGWAEATGWNKGGPRTVDAQHRMLRVAIGGLSAGNRAESANPEKTDETAADSSGARAIVWIHPDLDPAKPVQILTHLHGLTSRSDDPFAGWRENRADPSTSESDRAKAAARRHGRDATNPLGHKVRDVERDRIGQQVEALGDPQVMAVLPQGTGMGGAMFGRDFSPEALVGEVLTRLASESEVTRAVKRYTAAPASWSIVLSAHSAGGAALSDALAHKRARHVGGLILFDALWGMRKAGKLVSQQRDRLAAWVRANCVQLATVLGEPAPRDDKDRPAYDARMAAAIAAVPGVRGFYTAGYADTYRGLEAQLRGIVDEVIPEPYRDRVKPKFQITPAHTSHDRILGEVGAAGTAVAPLEQALGERSGFVAGPEAAPAGPAPAPTPARTLAPAPIGPAPAPAKPARTRPARTKAKSAKAHEAREAAPASPEVAAAADRVREAARAAAAPLVGTDHADDMVHVLTEQIVKRRRDPSAQWRKADRNHPALGLCAVLYGAEVVADLHTIDTHAGGRAAADTVRRQVFLGTLGGLVTDVRPHTAVAAPSAPLDQAAQIEAERALIPAVLPFIDGGDWRRVRVGVINEFGGFIVGTRRALARANAYFGSLQPPRFRNVNPGTRVHPDLNAAFARAEALIERRLAATPEPQRAQLTAELTTTIGRSWSANVRPNRNSPYRLSEHSFGAAIDFDANLNPNVGTRGGLGPVEDVTGRSPRATTSNRTAAQVEATATELRAISAAYQAAMASDAALAPVLLRLANAARAAATPNLSPLPSGEALVAAVVVTQASARATALRAALWPEGTAPGGGKAAPPKQITAVAQKIARIGDAYRASFTGPDHKRRTAATSEGTPGSVAAHGFLSLPALLVGALAGSDAGNLRWLGTQNGDYMHFELPERPHLRDDAIPDPAPPAADHGTHGPG